VKSRSHIPAALAALLCAVSFCCPRVEAVTPEALAPSNGPVIGNITFAGSVELAPTNSVDTATQVTAWHGLAPGDLPQVQSRDGTFTSFVTPGDGTTFHAPWNFNSGPVSNFWSVDGFSFDLLSSAIISQGSGGLHVAGTGTVSGNGFTSTSGTWNFTTQDPSAESRFSFSAASAAVPEPSTVLMLVIGGAFFVVARKSLSAKSKSVARLLHFR